MSFQNVKLSFIRILRMLRTLRPLRFISHNENMKIVVNSLINSFTAIVNVFIVIAFIWLIFGILGMSFMEGKMGYCIHEQNYGVSEAECNLIALQRSLPQGSLWYTHPWNFDNIFQSMVTLFVISTMEGWPSILFNAIDSNDPEYGPTKNENVMAAAFFLVFIFIGAFFMVNLFVGVIFMQFLEEQLKEKKIKFENWTLKQIEWVKLQELIKKAKPQFDIFFPPKNYFLRNIFSLVTSGPFDLFITSCILLNIVTMGLVFEGMPQTYSFALLGINYTFTGIFILEAFLKIAALGKQYFYLKWNVFDFLIVLFSISDIIIDILGSDFGSILRIGPQLFRVLRVMRVSRLFKLMRSKRLEHTKKILNTLSFSFPSLLNVLVLLALSYFIFSVLGVFLFSGVESNEFWNNEIYNFQNFINSLLLLFRASTGEDWHKFMFFFAARYNSVATYAFFISYILLTSFIIINLFMLVVVQEFEKNFFNSTNALKNYEMLNEGFNMVWNKFTVETRGARIKSSNIQRLFETLPYPYGFRSVEKGEEPYDPEILKKEVNKLNLVESREGIALRILQLDLLEDANGLIPYGVVLHTMFKNGHGNFDDLMNGGNEEIKILRKIKKTELKTLAHIIKRDMKSQISKTRKKQNEEEIQNIKKKRIYNPLIFILVSKMMFLAWKNYTNKNWDNIRYHKQEGLHLEEIEIETVNCSIEGLELDEIREIDLINGERKPFSEKLIHKSQFYENLKKHTDPLSMVMKPDDKEKESDKLSEKSPQFAAEGDSFNDSMRDMSEDEGLSKNKPGGLGMMSFFMETPDFQEPKTVEGNKTIR